MLSIFLPILPVSIETVPLKKVTTLSLFFLFQNEIEVQVMKFRYNQKHAS